jgi:XTP/dITP diphosphohydrolase
MLNGWIFLDTKKNISFITNNLHKLREAKIFLREYNIKVSHINKNKFEIQSDSFEEIVITAIKKALKEFAFSIIIEDAGLLVTELNNFPGPYSSFVFNAIGNKGILKLLKGSNEREAEFRSIIAFGDPKCQPICFTGSVSGYISKTERGVHGFGFDPIFIPFKGDGKTFSEMTIEEKNLISHRSTSFKKFAEWYQEKENNH